MQKKKSIMSRSLLNFDGVPVTERRLGDSPVGSAARSTGVHQLLRILDRQAEASETFA
jgi:hypothetical protein